MARHGNTSPQAGSEAPKHTVSSPGSSHGHAEDLEDDALDVPANTVIHDTPVKAHPSDGTVTSAEPSRAVDDTPTSVPPQTECTSDASALEPQCNPLPAPAAPPASAEHVNVVGYLANRRSASSLHMHQTPQAPQPPTQPIGQDDSARRLKKTSSFVRLSMSFDGKASIVTKDGSSPSPPRAPPIIYPSTGSSGTPNSQDGRVDQNERLQARTSLRRSSSGRSRDSRAWEFWCDKEARSELEEKAEKESSGSAADAIGLLRSASGRSILGPLPGKRNLLLSRQPSEYKRARLEDKRQPLQRASTFSGRFQSGSRNDATSHAQKKPRLKHSGSAVSVYMPGNDSDKENWTPDSDRSLSGRREQQTSSSRPALGESRSGNVTRTTARGDTGKAAGRRDGNENTDPEADAELVAFMRGERKSNSTSSEDDLDCVQGLLSLSQGNWR
jgi:hypothetical protein